MPIDKKPIIMHIGKLLEDLDIEPIRAVYMIVRQMHDMQFSAKKE